MIREAYEESARQPRRRNGAKYCHNCDSVTTPLSRLPNRSSHTVALRCRDLSTPLTRQRFSSKKETQYITAP